MREEWKMREILLVILCVLLMVSAAGATDDAWITFDPIYDTIIGEPLVISGATNLAAGTPVQIVGR